MTEPRDVVDLGAGTGKLTRSLVALGHRVTAVEPLPEMLAHLRGSRARRATRSRAAPRRSRSRCRERRRRHGRAGVPLVRSRRRRCARSHACCGPEGWLAPRLELARRRRSRGSAQLSEVAIGQRDDRGPRRRRSRRWSSGLFGRVEQATFPHVAAARPGDVCSISSARAATAPCSPTRNARRCSRASSSCSTSTRVDGVVDVAVRDRVLPRRCGSDAGRCPQRAHGLASRA